MPCSRLAVAELPPPAIGLVGAAGVLTALVPGSMMLMAAATTTLARDVYPLLHRRSGDRHVALAAKIFVPVVAAVALAFAIRGGETIVALLLMGYALVTQLFPALVASLAPRSVLTAPGAFAGIVVGVAIVALTTLSGVTLAALAPRLPGAILDLNIGVVALGGNVATAFVVSAVSRLLARHRRLGTGPISA